MFKFNIINKYILLLFFSLNIIMCNKKDIDIIKISAEEIIIEFDNNEVENLIKKYKNKTIQINGRMVSKGFPKDNIPSKNASYIIFGKVDNNNSPFFTGNTIIQCYFDKVVVHNLNEGDMITVNCKFKVIKIGYKQMKYIVFHKGIIIDPAVENTAE